MSTYDKLEEGYNSHLMRGSELNMPMNTPESGNGGFVADVPVKNDGAMDDVWIKNFIRSTNWKAKTQGFTIDGRTGYAEFSGIYARGDVSISGTLYGVHIVSSTIDSSTMLTSQITLDQSPTGGGVATPGYLRWSGGNRIWSDTDNNMGINALSGFIWFYGNSNQIAAFLENDQSIFYNGISCQGNLNVGTSASPYNARITGSLYFNKTGGTTTESIFKTIYPAGSNFLFYTGESHMFFGVDQSGTASVAVTTTATSLTDTRLSMTVNQYVGHIVACGQSLLVVTSNTANTFAGTGGWSLGGNPSNGQGWIVGKQRLWILGGSTEQTVIRNQMNVGSFTMSAYSEADRALVPKIAGSMFFNLTSQNLEVHDGAVWKVLKYV